ncbi:hypothetical protein [Denitrobaculum tricleocarpae]|uniref:Uncharacterized protein n=1 Tax=Denitrobaculum tricleocarpae TaxID=2591009 RepID=A0A545TMN5_9PROT|nr:hypothetical protein [Denitrobaculum tricleocarpae]TQV78489.1 hypothetical protein FKG95_18175 [Denitrobaculum tricleocarpae]
MLAFVGFILLGATAFGQETDDTQKLDGTAQDQWTATLAPAKNGDSYGPLEEIVIRIPDDVPFEILLRLGLEVDAIDVTPLLAFEDQSFTYRPQQALEPGEHELRMIELTPDGEVIARGSWVLFVSGDAGIADVSPDVDPFSLSATNSVEFSQRLDDKGFSNQPARGQVSGGGYADTAYSAGRWSVTGNANYLLETQKARSSTGRRFDLGEYNFNTRFDGEDIFGQVALGHQSLDIDNYIMSNYSRRGLSASLGSADEMIAVTGFSFLPESTVGSENITGLGDSDNRLMGFQATAHPVPAWGQDFSVTGIYYNGQGSNGGFGIGGDTIVNEGDGWGVTVEHFLFERSLQLTGQYARSNFEQGDVVVGEDEAQGDAWSFAAAYTPFQSEEIGGEYLSVTIGAQYERVDTFFNSLANSSLAADRESVLLYSDINWGSVSANAQALYQTNNVDDLEELPTERLSSYQFSANYYPTIDPPAEGETDWFGQPFLNLNAGTAGNKRIKTPEAYLGTDTDNQNYSVTLGGGSSYGAWGWQLSETFSGFLDRTNQSSDSTNYMTDVSANWAVSDAVQVNSGVQWSRFKDKMFDTRTNSINLNLGLQAEIIPETLNTALNYNLNLLTGDGDTPDNTIANGEIVWTILPPTENYVGVALAFQGLVENRDGNSDKSFDGTDWQAFGLLRISAPVSY